MKDAATITSVLHEKAEREFRLIVNQMFEPVYKLSNDYGHPRDPVEVRGSTSEGQPVEVFVRWYDLVTTLKCAAYDCFVSEQRSRAVSNFILKVEELDGMIQQHAEQ